MQKVVREFLAGGAVGAVAVCEAVSATVTATATATDGALSAGALAGGWSIQRWSALRIQPSTSAF